MGRLRAQKQTLPPTAPGALSRKDGWTRTRAPRHHVQAGHGHRGGRDPGRGGEEGEGGGAETAAGQRALKAGGGREARDGATRAPTAASR